MPLESRFQKAEINMISNTAYKLTIWYSFYNIYNYTDVFVYPTLDEAKHKLILERCHNEIKILDEKNQEINIEPKTKG
jgi:hypothetical protein